MERFFLEIPSENRKQDIIDYLNEFVEYKSDINGIGILDHTLSGLSFEQALYDCLHLCDEEYAKKLGRSQSKTFLLIRESDNKMVGSINVRWNLSEAMLRFGGHIGYGIRPTERHKGYNKINLYLGLIKAQEQGLNRVMLDCETSNIASSKTMEALGGELERTEIDPYDGLLTSVYWFDVNKCIDTHKDIYEPQIIRR